MHNHHKIIIRYYDEDNKETIKEEGIWATMISDNTYQIDNIPFFARSLSLGDIVSVEKKGGQMYADKVVKESGNSTVRIVFDDIDVLRLIRQYMKESNCVSEYNDIHQLVAINIPADVDYYELIKPYLEKGLKAGLWDYEESCLAHPKIL